MKKKKLPMIAVLFFVAGCQTGELEPPSTFVNTAHLDHLYQEVTMDSLPAAFIYIYAEYPDYQPVEAAGEGIACVDDVARAAIFYLRHYEYEHQKVSLEKARKLLQFLLDMQAENGLFYNFIYADHSINTTRSNSVPRADWWAWRALWALAEGYPIFRESDPEFAAQMKHSVERVFPAVDSLLQKYPETAETEGLEGPAWLPWGGAGDQGAVLLHGLVAYYKFTHDTATARRIQLTGEGLIALQLGDSDRFPYGAFRSWPDRWHAWGNSQAHALLLAGKSINQPKFIEHALMEVEHFYPYLMQENFLRELRFAINDRETNVVETIRFSQIAYDIRPMVLACLDAYYITGEEKYARQAGEIACWLLGKNLARKAMYDPQSGRCFDGINNPDDINENSGAESTIEALLTILELEQNPIAGEVFLTYFQEQRGRD
jgi:hypothetical protein